MVAQWLFKRVTHLVNVQGIHTRGVSKTLERAAKPRKVGTCHPCFDFLPVGIGLQLYRKRGKNSQHLLGVYC